MLQNIKPRLRITTGMWKLTEVLNVKKDNGALSLHIGDHHPSQTHTLSIVPSERLLLLISDTSPAHAPVQLSLQCTHVLKTTSYAFLS